MRISILLGLGLVLMACESRPDSTLQTGKDTPEATPEAQPAAVLGEVDAVDGQVSRRRGDASESASKGDGLIAGDAVLTGAESRARIALSEGSILAVGPGSTLELSEYQVSGSKRRGTLRVLAGQFWLRVVELAGVDTEVDIETPTAVAGIRGTTIWGDTERDLLCALAGTIEVKTKAAGGEQTLEAGECLSKIETETPEKLTPDAETVGKFLGEVHIGEPLEAK